MRQGLTGCVLVMLWGAAQAATSIQGRLLFSTDAFASMVLPTGTPASLKLSTAGGEVLHTYADRDGNFRFTSVPSGSYLLTVDCPAFMFQDVRVAVSKTGALSARNVLSGDAVPTSPQLLVRSLGRALYFDQRKPFDIWSFLKSPYGLMIGFMVFGIVVFPMLKVDPEEYREAMSQLGGQQAPAVAAAPPPPPQQQRRSPAQPRLRDR